MNEKPCPNFAAWSMENLVNFAKESHLRMYEQDQAIEQLRADLRDAMRLLREKQDART